MNRLAIFLSALPFCAFAQITIDSGDMPIPNQTFELSKGNLFSGFDWATTGENFDWDFGDLESNGNDNWVFEETGDSPFVYQIIFSNPWDPEHQASYGIATGIPNFIPNLTVTNAYQYLQNNEDFYASVGLGVTLNDIPVPARYVPVDQIYKFPMEFLNEHESYSEISFELPDVLSWKSKQTRNTIVDGWGNVTTPEGVFECLRVKHEIAITDSTVIDVLEIDIETDRPLETVYQWIAKDHGIPVLEVAQSFGLTTRILYRTASNNIIECMEREKLAYPIPSKGQVTIPHCEGAFLRIYNEKGTLTLEKRSASQPVDLSCHPSGIYTWTVTGDCQNSGTILILK